MTLAFVPLYSFVDEGLNIVMKMSLKFVKRLTVFYITSLQKVSWRLSAPNDICIFSHFLTRKRHILRIISISFCFKLDEAKKLKNWNLFPYDRG
jgi:hypothetical protein